MRNLYCLLIFLVAACDVFDKDEPIPSFVYIEAADLTVNSDGSQGEPTSAIIDASVFSNDIFVGTIELPGSIPILAEGATRIAIGAGIRNNGISSDRKIYPFYNFSEQTMDLKPGEIIPFNDDSIARFRYFEDDNFGGLEFLVEGFEGIGNIWVPAQLEGTPIINSSDNVLSGNNSGKIILDDDFPDFEVYSQLPDWDFSGINPSQTVYLELDYQGNNPLEIGIILNNSPQSKLFALGLNPTEEWTKVYVELTDEIGMGQTSNFRIYLEAAKITDENQAIIYLDNMKIVYAD